MAIKVLLVVLLGVGVNLTLDRETVTAVNTLLNLGSFYLLIYGQRKLRKEIDPKVNSIEEAVTQALETRQAGGRRQSDPPATVTDGGAV